MSCNNIWSHSSDFCDLVQLQLHESYVLPTLTYATAAIKLSEMQIASLNAYWNSVYRRIFHFNRWESVKYFIRGLGRLDFRHLRLQLSTKLYLSVQLCKNSVVGEVFKTFMFLKEFIQCSILSKWSKKTRFSTVKSIMYDIFDACITFWYNFVFCNVCSIFPFLLLYFGVLPMGIINVLIIWCQEVHLCLPSATTPRCQWAVKDSSVSSATKTPRSTLSHRRRCRRTYTSK